MYFDNDRKDPGATTVGEAMQNNRCHTSPVWKEFQYQLTSKQLRSNEMFTTASDTAANATAENSFVGPGRVHLVSTPLTGVTFTTDTIIGYLHVDYHAELCFPTNPQTAPPTRRARDIVSEVAFAQYDYRHVKAFENFAAGCSNPPSFYQFLSLFTAEGDLDQARTRLFDPDAQSFDLNQLSPNAPDDFLVRFSGLVVDTRRMGEDPSELEVKSSESCCKIC